MEINTFILTNFSNIISFDSCTSRHSFRRPFRIFKNWITKAQKIEFDSRYQWRYKKISMIFITKIWLFRTESDSILVFSGLHNPPGQDKKLENVSEKIRDKLWDLLPSDWRYISGHFRQSDRQFSLTYC